MNADPKIFRAAREKITPEGAWTQGAFARTARGTSIAPKNAKAECWCAMGVIVASGGFEPEIVALREFLNVSLAAWNDDPERTHAEVLAAFDGCIAKLEVKQ